MKKLIFTIFILLSFSFFNINCGGGGGVKRGIRYYENGDYGAALSMFIELEPDVSRWKPKQQALYCLYRGLTHLSIGERPMAEAYLLEAERLRQEDPRILRGNHLIRLQQGLSILYGNAIPQGNVTTNIIVEGE